MERGKEARAQNFNHRGHRGAELLRCHPEGCVLCRPKDLCNPPEMRGSFASLRMTTPECIPRLAKAARHEAPARMRMRAKRAIYGLARNARPPRGSPRSFDSRRVRARSGGQLSECIPRLAKAARRGAPNALLANKKGAACAAPGHRYITSPNPPPHTCRLAADHLQLVLDAEHARELAGSHARDLFVHGAVHRAVERHMPVGHDDANRTRRIGGVLA